MTLKALQRAPLKEQAGEVLRTAICDGRLAPGSRIVESRAAAELGVSRTPLREALIQLEREGLVTASPAKGYRVAPLCEREARDLYPILGALEALALRAIEQLDPACVERLRSLNRDLATAGSSPATLIRIDAEWHATLLANTRNRTARAMLEPLRRRVQRYELAFMRVEELARGSPSQHDEILDALLRNDVERAACIIESQWTDSVLTVVTLIQQRNPR